MKLKSSLVCLYLLLSFIISNKLIAQSNPTDNELEARYHQFDFWLGRWAVYRYDTDKLVGESHIMTINDSTGLLENYETVGSPFKGKSLNTYNRSSAKWEQYWIDNSGQVLKLEGELKGDNMVLQSMDELNGNRISWSQDENKAVRQTWEVSEDGGITWKVVFDGLYRKQAE